jgi:SAM-dependent methyltransferase
MATPDPTPYRIPNPDRAAVIARVLTEYLVIEPLEPGFARRFLSEGISTFLELGAATGPISRLLAPRGVRCTAVDRDPPPDRFEPMVRADLRAVPLPRASFDAVSAVNCLYFLGDPRDGIREARELLKPSGLFLAGSPSRYHDPEVKDLIPEWGVPGPFDAEEAASIVAEVFGEVEVEWWEGPAYLLETRDAVDDYFVMFEYPRDQVDAVELPLTITKSGINIWARR